MGKFRHYPYISCMGKKKQLWLNILPMPSPLLIFSKLSIIWPILDELISYKLEVNKVFFRLFEWLGLGIITKTFPISKFYHLEEMLT